jgi:CMP-N-acetylneuraminic acid synthetase
MKKVSVIITAHNYGKYLRQCLDSVLAQTYEDYEMVIVDDGSTDNTAEILEEYQKKHKTQIKILRLPGLGLASACNRGVNLSEGEYLIRLDADDYFDENILLVEAAYLDTHPNVDLVFPDYYRVTEDGKIIEHVRLLRVEEEIRLLHRSPLAAGAMFRRKCFEELGGYNEKLRFQEDYDFWLRFISRYKVKNINLPLMYYRQHPFSMSRDFYGRMEARRYVKEEFVKKYLSSKLEKLKIIAIIPARAESRINGGKLALKELNEKPLIAYTIEEAKKIDLFDRILVSTEDEEIALVAKQYGAEVPFLRPKELAAPGAPVEYVVQHVLDKLKEKENYRPDILVILHVISPLKKHYHIKEAIHTLLIFNVDTVISVTENKKFHWRPGADGLDPLFEKRLLKSEREILYEENGAIYVTGTENFEKTRNIVGRRVGYIEMLREESVQINSQFDFWLAEQLLKGSK